MTRSTCNMRHVSHKMHRSALAFLPAAMWLAALSPSIACAAPDDVEQVQAAGAAVENNGFEVAEVNFDQWVFPGARNANTGREQIVTRMNLQIADIDRVCGLDAEQKEKLQLAGGGDTKRYFDEVEVVRKKFMEVRKDQNAFGQIWQDIQPLQTKMSTGLFGASSLFAKTLRRMLSEAQVEKYEQVEANRRQFRYRAMVESSLALLENSMPLRADQHEMLVQMLLEKTKPPATFGQQEYYYVMYHLATMPEDGLKPLFDEHQWQSISQQFNQFRGMRQFLETNGMLAKEEKPERKKPKLALPIKVAE